MQSSCNPPGPPLAQISAFFPGHHAKAMQQNAEMREMEEEVQALLAGGAFCGVLSATAACVAYGILLSVALWEGWRKRCSAC